MTAKTTPQTNRIAVKVPQVAAMLGISRQRAYELIRSKEIPSFRIGGTGDTIVLLEDLHKTIERWKEQG